MAVRTMWGLLPAPFPFQSYKKTLLRLRLRKERVSDVQKVLKGGEPEIQFEDFTNTLRE